MSFFGLFKKGPKNNFEDIKQTWCDFKSLLERYSIEKQTEHSKLVQNNPEFQKKMERICMKSVN